MKPVSQTIAAQEIGNEASRGRAIYVRTLLGFTVLAILGGISLIVYQYQNQSALIEENALHEAVRHSTALTEFRTLYTTEVVTKARQNGLKISHDFRGHSDTIPLPATMSLLLGERIASRGVGIQSKIYSPFPFPWRQDGGLKDDFGKEAWASLSRDRTQAFHRFEEIAGTPVLRYATADIMRRDCVSCHNEHPDSPKVNWKLNDVRGVLEIIVPIDAAMSRTRTNVQESTVITILVVALGLLALGIAAGRLRRAAMQSESRVRSRTDEIDRSNRRLRKQMAELEQAELDVRVSQAQYQSLVETIPMNVLRKDLEGKFTFANQRFCETLGRPLKNIIGKDDSEFFPADLAKKFRADDKSVVQTKETIEAVEENLTPDGASIYVHVMKSPVIDAKGEVIGVQAVFWDVTEQKLAEESVQLSERRYRQLTEGAKDAIVVADSGGMMTLFNSAAEECFGYGQEEIIGQSITLLMPDSMLDLHQRGFERYVQTGESSVIGTTVELIGRRKSGEEFNLDLSLSSIELPEGPGLLAIIHDSSERHRMNRRVEQSEKLASLGMLSAGVAHEINNPLAYVSNNMMVLTRDVLSLRTALASYRSMSLQDDLDQHGRSERATEIAESNDLEYIDSNIERILESTSNGVHRVAEIVNNLRGFARLDSAETNLVDLQEAVRAAHEMIRGQLSRRKIELSIELGSIPNVDGKQAQLNQVVLNLLVNSMQAIEGGGHGEGTIEVRATETRGEVMLEIADDGPGLAPDDLGKIFDPFFTTKPVGEGTGLGLSISHGIIADHGGRIEVANRPEGGAVFRVYMKAVD